MKAPDRSEWLRKLGEASALPPDDERRQAVEAEVARRGGWAQAQWLSLLEEGERMRLELARADAPAGLEERLLAIPADTRPPMLPRTGPGRFVAIAALLLIVVGAIWMLRPVDTRSLEERLNAVGVMAVNDHRNTHSWDVTAETADELATKLRPHIPFEVNIPREVGGLGVVGGRLCKLGGHPVAFSLWKGQGPVTLLQIRRADFDLPADLAPRFMRPCRDGDRACEHDVLMFGRGEYVWVFVADDSRDLEVVRKKLDP